jgi:hypothetical protein
MFQNLLDALGCSVLLAGFRVARAGSNVIIKSRERLISAIRAVEVLK